ncbi:MAG: UvrD-helicase domain-containing protein, partial [bacterium]
MTEIFRPDRSPLNRGTTVIEASAGTGKTFSIAVIVLRMIIQKNINPEKILCVTFTKAATEELISRIRYFLKTAVYIQKGKS